MAYSAPALLNLAISLAQACHCRRIVWHKCSCKLPLPAIFSWQHDCVPDSHLVLSFACRISYTYRHDSIFAVSELMAPVCSVFARQILSWAAAGLYEGYIFFVLALRIAWQALYLQIFRFSVWKGKPTPGLALMNLRYRNEAGDSRGAQSKGRGNVRSSCHMP